VVADTVFGGTVFGGTVVDGTVVDNTPVGNTVVSSRAMHHATDFHSMPIPEARARCTRHDASCPVRVSPTCAAFHCWSAGGRLSFLKRGRPNPRSKWVFHF